MLLLLSSSLLGYKLKRHKLNDTLRTELSNMLMINGSMDSGQIDYNVYRTFLVAAPHLTIVFVPL